MKNLLIMTFMIFCVVKGWQQFGPKEPVEPLFKESYVAVYGRDSCGYTMRMVRNLQQSKVNYRYFNIDQLNHENELHQRMAQAGISTRRYNLPVVDINGDLTVRPKFKQVSRQYNQGVY